MQERKFSNDYSTRFVYLNKIFDFKQSKIAPLQIKQFIFDKGTRQWEMGDEGNLAYR